MIHDYAQKPKKKGASGEFARRLPISRSTDLALARYTFSAAHNSGRTKEPLQRDTSSQRERMSVRDTVKMIHDFGMQTITDREKVYVHVVTMIEPNKSVLHMQDNAMQETRPTLQVIFELL